MFHLYSGNSFSSRLFKVPRGQVSILPYLLSIMGYDKSGDWLGYFDLESHTGVWKGGVSDKGSWAEKTRRFSPRIPARCSPANNGRMIQRASSFRGTPKQGPLRSNGPPTPYQHSNSSSLLVVREKTLKLSSMSTRWFRFRLFAGITLSSLLN